MRSIGTWLAQLGPLRLVLLVCVALLIAFVPAAGTRAIYSGWGLVRTVLVPVLAPLLFMVLLLDALMARVFMSEATDNARRRLRDIVLLDLAVAAVVVLVWIPYYMALRP